MAIKKGQYIKFECRYPRNKKVNGVFEGMVTETGCFRSRFAYFRIDSAPKLAFPNSPKYITILEQDSFIKKGLVSNF